MHSVVYLVYSVVYGLVYIVFNVVHSLDGSVVHCLVQIEIGNSSFDEKVCQTTVALHFKLRKKRKKNNFYFLYICLYISESESSANGIGNFKVRREIVLR